MPGGKIVGMMEYYPKAQTTLVALGDNLNPEGLTVGLNRAQISDVIRCLGIDTPGGDLEPAVDWFRGQIKGQFICRLVGTEFV